MLLFLYRLIINLVKFFLISLPLQLVGMIVLACYVGVTSRPENNPTISTVSIDAVKLPYLLRWFDNADIHYSTFRSFTTYLNVYNTYSKWEWYYWLAIRNPINYFNYTYLGMTFPIQVESTSQSGDQNVGDSSGQHAGHKYIDVNGYYEYYYVYRYSFKPDMCFRFRMGYKIKDLDHLPGEYISDVFNINPFDGYNGT